jgi:hypothetical protein
MNQDSEFKANHLRYAVYLIPPFEIARQVEDVHRMLEKQFGFTAAAKFQVHATLKGFFKCDLCSVDNLVKALNPVINGQAAFPVQFNGFHIDDVGFGLDISKLGEKSNEPMNAFRAKLVEVIKPFIDVDCDFVESDLGSPFKAHITLAFRDIDPRERDNVMSYIEPASLPSDAFVANILNLLEFHSQDWGGRWEQTLTWRLLKSWHLG